MISSVSGPASSAVTITSPARPDLLQRLHDADRRLVPAGDVDGVELPFGILGQQRQGLLAGILRRVGVGLGELGLDDLDAGIVLQHVLPQIVAVSQIRKAPEKPLNTATLPLAPIASAMKRPMVEPM